MIKRIAIFLSFSVGFLSLSQEILWVRLLGFWGQGVPYILSVVLSCFLLGVAVGAIFGKKLCSKPFFSIRWACYIWLGIGVSDVLIPHLFPWMMASNFYMPLFMVLIFFTAALKATIFPIAHHLFTRVDANRVGASLSYVYMANIAGSSLGPILTGFVLLNTLSLFDIFTLIGFLGVLIALLMGVNFLKPISRKVFGYYALVLVPMISISLFGRPSLSDVIQGMEDDPIVFVLENRQGVVHVVEDNDGRVVYGGNVYDGRLNILLTKNTNMIDRVFLLSALNPQAKNVLVVGLSGGAWTRVLAGNSNIQKIDVVEINPGYIDLIKTNDHIAHFLKDERVSIFIDDGRRWLRNANLQNHYDLIVMNTTFHWRLYSTNLLSREMMLLAKESLSVDGIFAFNATGSKDAHYTAASVFDESYRWSNFIYSSNRPFLKSTEEIADTIRHLYPFSSWPYEDFSSVDLESLFGKNDFFSIEQEAASIGRPLEIITDGNMIVEYKYGRE